MNWVALSKKSPVRTNILEDTSAGKSTRQRWAREKEATIGAGVCKWWTDGLCSDDGRVGATVVCKHGNEWRFRCSFLGTCRVKVIDAELWAIVLGLDVAIDMRESLQTHGLSTMAVFSD